MFKNQKKPALFMEGEGAAQDEVRIGPVPVTSKSGMPEGVLTEVLSDLDLSEPGVETPLQPAQVPKKRTLRPMVEPKSRSDRQLLNEAIDALNWGISSFRSLRRMENGNEEYDESITSSYKSFYSKGQYLAGSVPEYIEQVQKKLFKVAAEKLEEIARTNPDNVEVAGHALRAASRVRKLGDLQASLRDHAFSERRKKVLSH